jgi:hypothetical protein
MNRLFPGATFEEINSPKTKLMNDEKYEDNSITIKNIINHSLKTKTYCSWEESGWVRARIFKLVRVPRIDSKE